MLIYLQLTFSSFLSECAFRETGNALVEVMTIDDQDNMPLYFFLFERGESLHYSFRKRQIVVLITFFWQLSKKNFRGRSTQFHIVFLIYIYSLYHTHL